MPPTPCAHCGNNFMMNVNDAEALKLCNNCMYKEQKKNPKKGNDMENVGILIQCPKKIQVEIEEYCINNGMDFSKYFLDLHANFVETKKEVNEIMEEIAPKKTKVNKK